MSRFNLFTAETGGVHGGEPAGYATAWRPIHPEIGGQRIKGNVLDVEPHGAATPYHWETATEEWLLVLEGRATVRTPDGEQELRAGDVVCFAPGPGGAHQVLNRTPDPLRIAMLSDTPRANAFVYPDSDKIAFDSHEYGQQFRRADAVDHWEGEGG